MSQPRDGSFPFDVLLFIPADGRIGILCGLAGAKRAAPLRPVVLRLGVAAEEAAEGENKNGDEGIFHGAEQA